MALSDSETDVVLLIWNDCRELIAALKGQRWDVTKWAVTLDLAVAGAGAAAGQAKYVFFTLSLVVVAVGLGLLFHYNQRITRVRERLTRVGAFATARIFDFNKEMGLALASNKGPEHDREELIAFSAAITLSLLPAVLLLVTT